MNLKERKRMVKTFLLLHKAHSALVSASESIKNDFDYGIQVYCNDKVHVFSGIDVIANALGVPLEYAARTCSEYPHQYSFIYEGVNYYQIEEQELAYE